MNSRPLTTVTSDHEDQIALTANDILRLNSNSAFFVPSPDSPALYVRRKWRQAQFMADAFWRRYKKEYLTLLQERQKWTIDKRSVKLDDIVFVVDNSLPRNEWNVGRIVKVHYSNDNKV